MPRAGSGDCAGSGESGPCAYASERTAAIGSGEAGAVHEAAVQPDVAGGIARESGPLDLDERTAMLMFYRCLVWAKVRRSGDTGLHAS